MTEQKVIAKGGEQREGQKTNITISPLSENKGGKIRVPENTEHFTIEHISRKSRKPRKVEFRREKKMEQAWVISLITQWSQKRRKPRCFFSAPEHWSSKQGKGQRLRSYVANRLCVFVLPSACSEGTWAAPVGTTQTSVPAATAADLFVSRLQSGHAASDSRARRGAAGRAPGNLPRTARRARRRGSRASRRRGLARPESTAQLGYAEAAWSTSRSFSTCCRDPRPGGPAPTSEYDLVFLFLLWGIGREWKRLRHGCGYRGLFPEKFQAPIATFTSSQRLPPSSKTRHIGKGLLLHVTPRQGKGETRQAFARGGGRRARCGRTGQAGTGSLRGDGEAGACGPGSPGPPRQGGPTRPTWARGRTRGRGPKPAGAGEAESSDPPGRRGSPSLLSETPPHSAAHPPSRG